MRKLMELVALLLWAIFAQPLAAQQQLTQSNDLRQSVASFYENPSQFQSSKFDNHYYIWLNFSEAPAKDARQFLKSKNIELLSYHSPKRMLVAIPSDTPADVLEELEVTQLQSFTAAEKLSEPLRQKEYPEWAMPSAGMLDVAINFAKNVDQQTITDLLESYEIQVLEDEYRGGRTIVGRINTNQLEDLANTPYILYLDIVQEPAQRLNHENCVQQRVNVLNCNVPGQRNLNGKGVVVGIGDGGELGEHIDFGDRAINIALGTYSSFGAHGDHVAGIIGGAGNVNPRHRGMAPEATLLMQKTSLITYYAADYVTDYGMVLTNNSYGTSFNCLTNGTYNYSSQNLDWQMREYPKLLHVFAAGNSGGRTCDDYPSGYRTVLRYYQSAKNVLTVGSVQENRTIWASSSRGPVADGRIKPEICGIGAGVTSTGRNFDYWKASGTSMSSPSVVGTMALLIERYRQLNNNEDPDGALVKAITCNTADDLGNAGPDYTFGFGLVNGRRAVQLIENNQFIKSSISSGETQTHSITVPAGTDEVRVMLYWHDMEAAAFPQKALVNDLDIKVSDPSSTEYMPWVLNIDPTKVAEVATRGIDTLNNIEQITINNPSGGNYTITINGSAVPFGPQDYYIVYDFMQPEVVVTYPYGGETLVPGASELIQWDADDVNISTFKVEYSLNGGTDWILITDSETADTRYTPWVVPDVFTEQGIIRVTKNTNGLTDVNENYFSIISIPEIQTISSQCEGIVQLSWTKIDQASGYEIMMFDGKEMINVGNSTDTVHLINKALNYGERYWFSVRAKTPTSIYSERAVASYVIPEENWLCPWGDDPKLGGIKIDVDRGREATSAALTNSENITVKVKNAGNNRIQKFKVFYSVDGGQPISEICMQTVEPGDSIWFTFTKKADFSAAGTHQVDAWVDFGRDNHNFNDTIFNAVRAVQLDNKPLTLPVLISFPENQDKLLTKSYIGIDDLQNWDFETNSSGVMRLKEGRLMMIPVDLEENAVIDNSAVATFNLADVNALSGQVLLDFKYTTHPDLVSPLGDEPSNGSGKYNKVWIRGSDLDEWTLLTALDKIDDKWNTVKALNMSKVLNAAGQQFSSSTQIKFDQTQLIAYSIDDINLYSQEVDEDELLDFEVEKFNEAAIITWVTPIYNESDYFEVQVATPRTIQTDRPFCTVGRVSAENNKSDEKTYEFVDHVTEEKGYRYYRLKQVVTNEMEVLSPIHILDFTETTQGVSIFPNPFSKELYYKHTGELSENIHLQLINNQGKIISQFTVDVEGPQQINIPFEEKLSEGIYWLRVAASGRTATYKLTKLDLR